MTRRIGGVRLVAVTKPEASRQPTRDGASMEQRAITVAVAQGKLPESVPVTLPGEPWRGGAGVMTGRRPQPAPNSIDVAAKYLGDVVCYHNRCLPEWSEAKLRYPCDRCYDWALAHLHELATHTFPKERKHGIRSSKAASPQAAKGRKQRRAKPGKPKGKPVASSARNSGAKRGR